MVGRQCLGEGPQRLSPLSLIDGLRMRRDAGHTALGTTSHRGLATVADGQSRRDRVEPRREAPRIPIALDILVGFDKGLLGNVVCRVVIFSHSKGQPVDIFLISFHQYFKGV